MSKGGDILWGFEKRECAIVGAEEVAEEPEIVGRVCLGELEILFGVDLVDWPSHAVEPPRDSIAVEEVRPLQLAVGFDVDFDQAVNLIEWQRGPARSFE